MGSPARRLTNPITRCRDQPHYGYAGTDDRRGTDRNLDTKRLTLMSGRSRDAEMGGWSKVASYARDMSDGMAYGHLGRSGLLVSRIGLGTMVFGYLADEATSFSVMDAAIDAGINFVDTADVYGGPQ